MNNVKRPEGVSDADWAAHQRGIEAIRAGAASFQGGVATANAIRATEPTPVETPHAGTDTAPFSQTPSTMPPE